MAHSTSIPHRRIRLVFNGCVQGVGFRPFIYNLATELGLTGEVCNGPQGVVVEVEGPQPDLVRFQALVPERMPPLASIDESLVESMEPKGSKKFVITPSQKHQLSKTYAMPDLATCQACLKELRDPKDRRYRYPFINCTHCGPRYSIMASLPYDRAATSMSLFRLCLYCNKEYTRVVDRRFHAQPVACPSCGPFLHLRDARGGIEAEGDEALRQAARRLKQGAVLAVKSMGGFQLMCDAGNEEAVARLRKGKRRDSKPLAVMVGNVAEARKLAEVSEAEAALLCSTAAPIVLLRKRGKTSLAASVAPGTAYVGVMVAFTPMHHLLLEDFAGPLVATSGNLHDEPLCYQNRDALVRLQGIADGFLLHNRAILNPVDDSVAMVVGTQAVVLRRARGYVPLPLPGPARDGFAIGADLKNTFALARDGKAFLSPHHGDLGGVATTEVMALNLARYTRLFGFGGFARRDLHPDYHGSQMAPWATGVQHHHAHFHAVIAEHKITEPVLGVMWDGTGYGGDGTIWGGEAFTFEDGTITRVGRLKPFPLPGGTKAILEPKRTALGLLYVAFGESWRDHCPEHLAQQFSGAELEMLAQMLVKGTQAPLTSAMGRLFDGVSALLGLCYENRHEAMAPMALEARALEEEAGEPLPFLWEPEGQAGAGTLMCWDWTPMVRALLADTQNAAMRFHQTLVHMIGAAARTSERVALGGGCFQNRLLLEQTLLYLAGQGKVVHFPNAVPPGDGGIAYGQLFAPDKT